MRKIGSITPIWNNEIFIKPHFTMLSNLNRNVVILGEKPWDEYAKDFNISSVKDKSEEILKNDFPKVKIIKDRVGHFCGGLFNQGLEELSDMDIVLKLDVDMLFEKKDWDRLIDFLSGTDYDAFRLDYYECSKTYAYGTKCGSKHNEFEKDYIAVSPRNQFGSGLIYPSKKEYLINWPDFTCHHMRCWKPSQRNINRDVIDNPMPRELINMFDKKLLNSFLKLS